MLDFQLFPFVPSRYLIKSVVRGYEFYNDCRADKEATKVLRQTINEGLRGLCCSLHEQIASPYVLTTEDRKLEPEILECLLLRIHCHPGAVDRFNREFAFSLFRFARKNSSSVPCLVLGKRGRVILLPHYNLPKQPCLPPPGWVRAKVARFGQGKAG
jgi:hypothetical protein